uniref:(California timema) hypothetical protein n=1 Tax=Timema californicum TaxID=61474 RepID=A0A7R9P3H5_TIMCA|nr:unnamed protein product [Timema californicum]
MVLCDDPDENIYQRHKELCVNLNMDQGTADEAWHNYENIRQNCTLEGDQLHWLGCALYVACRSSTADTVSRSGVVHGNCVGLTRLLRLCKLSLIQFFNKSKKWADMANLPSQFHDKIERLERNFAVSMVIFKKFQPIFTYMFLNPMNTTPKQPKSRKQRSQPCTPSKVFDFCWTLFVCVKAEFSEISDDLFNSYHLLLACCDMIFANAFMAGRRDLLNPQFPGLPNNYYDDNFNLPSEPPCVIDHLCQKHDGLPVEAKTIKVYTWRNHIRKLFEKKSLRGDPLTLTGILEPNNFELNCKAINKIYDAYVLNVGDFDERIFLSECKRLRSLGPGAMHCHLIAGLVAANRPILKARNFRGEDSNSDIGTPIKMCDDLTEKLQTKKSWNHQYGALANALVVLSLTAEDGEIELRQLAPPTPLTGREFLKGKEDHQNITPVSTATQSVSRLHSMLLGRQASPSDGLITIFNSTAEDGEIEVRISLANTLVVLSSTAEDGEIEVRISVGSCTRNPRKKVEEHVKEMGTLFCTQFTQQQPSNPPSMQIDFPRKRLQLGETLYYKLLENILLDERKKKPKDFDFSNLLEQDIFHQTLFACCLEIVIYSYNSQRKFPWILEALNLEPYYFYKVIEIIVRVEDQLSRDMVKHLNLIEEQILEALAWRSDSPLWESIKSSGLPVPSCEDACLPSQLYDESTALNSNPVIRRLALDSERLQGSPQSSPVSSVSDRFQSPVPSTLARKKLFMEGSALRTVKPGQSAKAIVEHYSRSPSTRKRLHTVMEEMVLPVLELIQFVDTRWSSEYNMLSRLHAVRKAVGAELANSENNIEILTEVEWKQAAGIVEVLGPLADATKEISGDNKALKSRFSFYDSDPIFCPSMLCDPRFRGVLIDDMVAVNTLAIEVKKLSDKSSLEPNVKDEHPSCSSSSSGLWSSFDSIPNTTQPAIDNNTVEGENGQRYIPISYVPGTGSVIIQAQPMKHDSPEASKSDVKVEQNSSKPDQSASKPLDQLVKQEQAAGGNQEQPVTQQQMASVNNAVRPRRAGSLGLFFRKFYHLASVRMQDLCKNLAITDRDLKRKIWTCFEYTIIHHMDLMKDRHLDQILMCSVYVICKVAVKEKTFTDIMRCYRHQPQAASHVYRSVLLRKKPSADSSSSSSVDSSEANTLKEEGREREPVRSSSTLPATRPLSAPPTPTQMSGTFNSFESEDRGDLIKFYNTVYVQKLQSFAVKFSTNGNQSDNLTLSPLPLGKSLSMSPCRRISERHNVVIRSLENISTPLSPNTPEPLSYRFSRSPAKDLKAINAMIQIDTRKINKRLLVDDTADDDAPPVKRPTPVVAKKLQNLIGDRLGQVQD